MLVPLKVDKRKHSPSKDTLALRFAYIIEFVDGLYDFAIFRKELELKLREAKKRKKEKYANKIKAMEEISEKEKNKWKSFNNKVRCGINVLFYYFVFV